MENINNTKNTLFHWHDFRIKIIFESILVGVFGGLLVVAYRYMLEKALDFAKFIYNFEHTNLWFIPIWAIALAIGGYIVGVIIKLEPTSSGSGIPQVEAVLLRKLDMNWWRVIVAKFIGGILCIGAGLSLGREGPSIQLGAAVGQGFGRIFKRVKLEEKFLITSGASAGLAAAFNAPLSGAIFALEEVHKNFSAVVMTSALSASITADLISKNFFGMKPVFDFKNIKPIPLHSYMYLIMLGIILGFTGILFSKALLSTQTLYSKQKLFSEKTRPIIPFLLAGVLGFVLPQVLGGGHELIVAITNSPYTLKLLIIVLIVKFIFTVISFGSSAPGGIFLPLLVIGALIGAIYGNVLHILFGYPTQYIENMMILAMAGYFAAIVKAPITGIILITEMTGSFSHLLSVSIVCLIAYVVTDIFELKPIYESLLERMLLKGNSKFEGDKSTKVILELSVCIGSIVERKRVKDISWPKACLLVGIKRGQEELIPNGDTMIYAGDYLIVLANEDYAAEIRECISDAAEECEI